MEFPSHSADWHMWQPSIRRVTIAVYEGKHRKRHMGRGAKVGRGRKQLTCNSAKACSGNVDSSVESSSWAAIGTVSCEPTRSPSF